MHLAKWQRDVGICYITASVSVGITLSKSSNDQLPIDDLEHRWPISIIIAIGVDQINIRGCLLYLIEYAATFTFYTIFSNTNQTIRVSVRKHFESFESLVIQSGDLIREGHHRCGRRRTADVTTAANCDIRVT